MLTFYFTHISVFVIKMLKLQLQYHKKCDIILTEINFIRRSLLYGLDFEMA